MHYTLKFIEALPALLFLGIFRFLPLRWASALGGALARTMGPLLPAHRIGLKNVQLAFPEWPAEKHARVLRGAWDNLGRTVGEMPHLKKIIHNRVTCPGLTRMQDWEAIPEPIVYIGAHLANWEVQPLYVTANGIDLGALARRPNNPWMAKVLENIRRNAATVDLIYKGNESAKPLLKKLQKGGKVGFLVDQKLNQGAEIPFFGTLAKTPTAFVRIAKRAGARLVPCHLIRYPGVHFELRVGEDISLEGDEEAALIRVNKLIESWIREYPEQWLWFHRRWPKEIYSR